MTLVFIDTGAFYALADSKDAAHKRARDFHNGFAGLFLTTDFIFAETMSLLTKRLGKKTAARFGEGIRQSSRIRMSEVSPAEREAAWVLFGGRLDQDYDLIDCVSFTVMDSHGIREVFGFDRHFEQYGFRLLPA